MNDTQKQPPTTILVKHRPQIKLYKTNKTISHYEHGDIPYSLGNIATIVISGSLTYNFNKPTPKTVEASKNNEEKESLLPLVVRDVRPMGSAKVLMGTLEKI
jgi:hypothetical protein